MTEEKPTGLAPDHLVVVHQNSIYELRAALRDSLLAIPDTDSLKRIYSTEADREKVMRRLTLEAAHQFLFKKIIPNPNRQEFPDGSVEIGHSDKEEDVAFERLTTAIRDFRHDMDRLDKGATAELVLAPIEQIGKKKAVVISANRKMILLAVMFVENRSPKMTEAEQLNIASDYTGFSATTLRTYVRNLRRAIMAYKKHAARGKLAFNRAECEHYKSLLAKYEKIARKSDANIAELIKPVLAVHGIKHQAIESKKR